MPREKSIEDKIREYLDRLPNCYHEKTHGGFYGDNGKPDITGCIEGRRFEIEVKRPGEYPTVLQKRKLQLWQEAGAIVGVARSVEDAKKILREGLK